MTLWSKTTVFLSVFCICLGTAGAASADKARDGQAVMGYLETVFVGQLRLEMRGKLDTGADSSSIHARDIELYKRDDRDTWVRFRIVGKNRRSIRYDQNVIRFALIKKKDGGTIRRPVIRLPLCIGDVSGRAEFNLADREDFEYDALIGREFLASRILVDSGQTFTIGDSCRADDD